jgi:hypothetical protein
MRPVAKQYRFAVGQPEGIANVKVSLAFDKSRMVNGAWILAYGGMVGLLNETISGSRGYRDE